VYNQERNHQEISQKYYCQQHKGQEMMGQQEDDLARESFKISFTQKAYMECWKVPEDFLGGNFVSQVSGVRAE
jgi:hypothetical protein